MGVEGFNKGGCLGAWVDGNQVLGGVLPNLTYITTLGPGFATPPLTLITPSLGVPYPTLNPNHPLPAPWDSPTTSPGWGLPPLPCQGLAYHSQHATPAVGPHVRHGG